MENVFTKEFQTLQFPFCVLRNATMYVPLYTNSYPFHGVWIYIYNKIQFTNNLLLDLRI